MINITSLSDNIIIFTINKKFKKNSDLWQVEIVDSNGETGWFSNIKVTDSENIYISYYERLSNSLKIARYINSNWTTETVDSNGDVGTYTSIAVDSIGNPHISYYDIKNQDLKYAKWDGKSWIINIVDSNGNVGLDTSINIDNNNYPHIGYYDLTNGNLKYAKWTGLEWEIEIVDSESNVGAGTSLELDNEGNPHISYHFALEKGLKYAYKTNNGWEINNIDSDCFVYWSTSISLDQDSNPHIAYFDVGTNSEEWYLKYAYLKKDVWIIEIIDPKMKSFWYDWGVSIDASNEDIIHIGYYKWSERDMNYAWKINNLWSKETIDSYGAVGAYSSLDIGTDGYPQISYMDRSDLILKYAKKIQYAPSTPDIPTGKNYGLINKEYTYSTISSDYEGDKIKYGWDWGDNSNIEWTDYYDSNETVEITHTWTEKSTYQIRVKAVDINGYESEWSDRLIFKTSLFFPKNIIKNINNFYLKIINYQNQNS